MRRTLSTAAVLAVALTIAPATAPHGVSSAPVHVIVRTAPGAERTVERTLAALGGRVELRLGLIDGFSAAVPSQQLVRLAATPGVAEVTPDELLHAQSATSMTGASSFSPTTDMGSMYNITKMTGARSFWSAGYTGKGVDVAVLDSGVSPVDGLTAPGKTVNGPDLSFESQAPNLNHLDTFGHGTFMAGIVGGRSDAAPTTASAYANDSTDFLGMAPDARIVSIKVADAHGAADVSQVIAAIDWVVQHKADTGYNIKVLNLSYGTNTTQSYTIDPLAYAAEQAWKHGLVVVASAGNSGYQKGSGANGLADPAYDPYLISVGAADPMGTSSLTDDTVSSFSAGACTGCTNPSFVAPGAHIVSLRDPQSLIDQTYSSTGAVTNTLFRGSGTSQAAAVVSGAAALILQKYPKATPAQVRQLLINTTTKLSGTYTAAQQGAGEINLAKAVSASLPSASPRYTNASGTGSLDASRGQGRLSMNGVPLTGNYDIFGAAFSPSAMASAEATANSWSAGTWNGNSWSGNSWSGNSWSANTWSAASWTAKAWSGASWSSVTWTGASWDMLAKSWSGADWTSNNWLAGSWSSDAWSDSVWATASWN